MADKRSLGLYGLVFGIVTGVVLLVAAVTVQAQIGAVAAPDNAGIVGAPPSVAR
jgi:hypothetical protein